MTKAVTEAWGAGSAQGKAAKRRQRYPTLAYLEKTARRRVPRFAFDFVEAGTGGHLGVRHNREALDGIQIVPRYGAAASVSTDVELFGMRYATPIGIAPVGTDGLIWPGATLALAHTAATARIPYIVGTLASASLETVASICPDSFWFQLYGLPAKDHAVSFDLLKRAAAAGAHALVVTLDAPVRPKRPKDMRNGLVVPFRPTPRTVFDVASSPLWALQLLKAGTPGFPNVERYLGTKPTLAASAGFVQREIKGTFSWDEMRRLRDQWPRALVVKGVLHPGDAEQAIAIGADGVLVSNHGGRQSDAAPPAIDVLPGIVAAVGTKTTVLFDSGIQSGLDAMRALALGAQAVFCGRAFLFGLGALGDSGSDYVADLLADELRVAMAQHGVATFGQLRNAERRHPSAFRFKNGTPPV
ncbi:alpha-hydroxy acid oxidase [Pseudorhodoplanes sinuspersici]|uniref:Alpha-hydroxy-acid oxidizing enzyme n=1 Tax=Pseudorhodoplanes sinuspersici TaxID=1235591 RepID=A0A1W6ZKB1_9HYPH|nr:alpha-hydroxy acid oxidase [Pseudorhodoplanes sinuspersici]ARP97779.1 alpha-hydroxy-acid oxidizing enzyme [Pseudorhodoplanes sinuspersici]RKE68494.1 L-lactate dehydrogenase (cytochrome) [Pseudorhodoplanes sinuspersici]